MAIMLVFNLRDVVERIRVQEKAIMALCVNQAKMPRKDFILSFPDNETDLNWLPGQIKAGQNYASVLKECEEDILRAQHKLIAIEEECGVTISAIKDINRKMSIGSRSRRNTRTAACSSWT